MRVVVFRISDFGLSIRAIAVRVWHRGLGIVVWLSSPGIYVAFVQPKPLFSGDWIKVFVRVCRMLNKAAFLGEFPQLSDRLIGEIIRIDSGRSGSYRERPFARRDAAGRFSAGMVIL